MRQRVLQDSNKNLFFKINYCFRRICLSCSYGLVTWTHWLKMITSFYARLLLKLNLQHSIILVPIHCFFVILKPLNFGACRSSNEAKKFQNNRSHIILFSFFYWHITGIRRTRFCFLSKGFLLQLNFSLAYFRR